MSTAATGIPIGSKIPTPREGEVGLVLSSREGRIKMDARVLPYRTLVDNFCTKGEVGDELKSLEESNAEVRRAMAYLEKVLGRWHAFKDSKPGREGLLETLNHRQHIADLQGDIEPAKNGLLLAIIKAKGWYDDLRIKD